MFAPPVTRMKFFVACPPGRRGGGGGGGPFVLRDAATRLDLAIRLVRLHTGGLLAWPEPRQLAAHDRHCGCRAAFQPEASGTVGLLVGHALIAPSRRFSTTLAFGFSLPASIAAQGRRYCPKSASSPAWLVRLHAHVDSATMTTYDEQLTQLPGVCGAYSSCCSQCHCPGKSQLSGV